jgi:hypothetical protein
MNSCTSWTGAWHGALAEGHKPMKIIFLVIDGVMKPMRACGFCRTSPGAVLMLDPGGNGTCPTCSI